MKYFIILLVTFLWCICSVIGQENIPITIKKKSFYQGDKKLTSKELKAVLMNTPESATEYKIANSKATIGLIPMVAGTGLCLYGAAVGLKQSIDENKAISDGNLYYKSDQSKYVTPVLVGACLVMAGIPFILSSQKHILKSIELYNANTKAKTGYNPRLEFGITQDGIGMVYRF